MSFTIEVKHFDSPNVVTYTIPWSANLTIRDAMQKCHDNPSEHPFTFWVQYYGTYNQTFLGYMTVEINSRRRGGPYFWAVYLNGVLTNNSLAAGPLQPNDVIEFKYEQYSSKLHANTVYEMAMKTETEIERQYMLA